MADAKLRHQVAQAALVDIGSDHGCMLRWALARLRSLVWRSQRVTHYAVRRHGGNDDRLEAAIGVTR